MRTRFKGGTYMKPFGNKDVREERLTINFTKEEKEFLKEVSKKNGYTTMAAYIRKCICDATKNELEGEI